MRERQLGRLFLRYQRRGDVAALTSVFDATAPALLGLARQLVRGSDQPEDVVQATFLTAIERARSFDPARPLMPWLAGILVHVARRANERAGRRIEPERLVERAAADPAQQASEAELFDALRRALAELPERYRLVLQPFLQRGESPSAIARERGLAPGTVRVHIHRGLELLRRALPAGHAAAALSVPSDATALSRMRARVESAARAAAPAAPPASAMSTAAATALVAGGQRAALVAVVLLAAGAGVWQLARVERERVAEARADEPRALEAAPDAAGRGGATDDGGQLVGRSEPEQGRRSALESAPPAAAHEAASLLAHVSGLGPKAPAELTLVVKSPSVANRATRVAIPGDGPLSVSLSELFAGSTEAPARIALTVDHPACASFACEIEAAPPGSAPRFVADVPLEIVRRVLEGRVALAEPRDRAPWVGFYPDGEEPDVRPLGQPTVRPCRADGSFSLVVAESSGWLAAIAEGHAPSGFRVELPRVELVDVGTVELGLGAAIEGVAYSGQRQIAPGHVVAQFTDAQGAPSSSLIGTSLAFFPDAVVLSYARVAVDEAGRFRIGALTPGEHDLLFVPDLRVSGYSDPHGQGTRVTAPVAGVELESPIRVYTLRVTCAGEPVADATVHYHLPEGSVSGPTEADGHYAFFMASNDPTQHRVEVRKPGFAQRELAFGAQDFDASGSLEVELERTAPASDLTLELVAAHGAVGPLRLDVALAGSDWTLVRFLAPADGIVALGEVPSGDMSVRVAPERDLAAEPAKQARWLPTDAVVTCRPSNAERARIALKPGGRVLFQVSGVDARGPGAWHLRGPDAGGPMTLLAWDFERNACIELPAPMQIERDGTYSLQRALLPGDYVLSITLRERAPLALPFTIAAGDVASVQVALDAH